MLKLLKTNRFVKFLVLLFLVQPLYHLQLKAQQVELWYNIQHRRQFAGIFAETQAAHQEIRNRMVEMQQSGYFMPSLDTIQKLENKYTIEVKAGTRYQWRNFTGGSLPAWLQNKLKGLPQTGEYFSQEKIDNLLASVLEQAQNYGYPFASTSLDNLEIGDSTISAILNYIPGPRIMIDSIDVNRDLKLKKKFLYRLLDLQPGALYSQEKVESISNRIARVDYLGQQSSYNVAFQDNRAILYLNLVNEKVNFADGLLGIMVDDQQQVHFNGSLELQLQNLFGAGKKIDLHWIKPDESSQNLELNYQHPFIFNSPVELDAQFSLLKQDSSFLNRHFQLAVGAGTTNTLAYFFTFTHRASQIFLPGDDLDYADLEARFYGIRLKWISAGNNSPFNAQMEIQAGNRLLEPALKTSNEHQSSTQLLTSLKTRYRKVLGDVFFLQSKSNLQKLWSSNYQLNELYRLGGLQSLRGFNENQFYAEAFASLSLEFGIQLDQKSELFTFYDQALIYNRHSSLLSDHPYGMGLGMNLQTGQGIFHLVWALGNSAAQTMNFQQSRIHFGYKARF